MRVAVLQFKTGLDVAENLATCRQMIDKAASCNPDLLVLPEFCNALSWYDDNQHAWQQALALDSNFLKVIASKAIDHNCYVVINVSLRRKYPDITVTSCLFSPCGELINCADKQTLMGHENDFFVRASNQSEVINTEFGRIGMFPCRDGVTCETPRSLALRGAQLFCDSLNSFAIDEASLHVPARAPENKVFLASANKIGPLIPEAILSDVALATNIPEQFLYGAGESQIVDPSGNVLAKASKGDEGFVFADIDLSDSNDKCRPDGSNLFCNRRVELYQPIISQEHDRACQGGSSEVSIALLRPAAALVDPVQRIQAVKHQLSSLTEDLIVLPELFFTNRSAINQPALAEQLSDLAIKAIASGLNTEQVVATSLVIEKQHQAVLIDHQGLRFSQGQLHQCNRHLWTPLANSLQTYSLPWGRVALLTGDDACYPEIVKVAALQGIHALICPIDIQENWESQYGLLSRAAENRICVIASSREHHLIKNTGLIANLETDFTIMTPWQTRQFDGFINNPIVTLQQGDVTKAVIAPIAANNKLMSANTDLLNDRPWQLSQTLILNQQALQPKEAP